MSRIVAITPSEKALSQMPRLPVRADGKVTYEKLLDAVAAFLLENDPSEISLTKLAEETETPVASVYHFFPNPEAAAAGLALRYVDLAARDVMSNQFIKEAENWQDVIKDLLSRGRDFYAKYPAALRLRLGSGQSLGVKHVMLQSTWSLAEVTKSELDRLFQVPDGFGFVNELAYGILISDALWSASIALHGEITDELAEEAERAVAASLEPIFGTRLRRRAPALKES